MISLKRTSIGQRLAIGFGLVLALLSLMAIAAIIQMSRLAANTEYFSANLVPSYEAEFRIARSLADIRRYEYRHVLSVTEQDKDTAEVKIREAREAIKADLDRYAKTLISDGDDKRHMIEARVAMEAYFTTWDRLRPLSWLTATEPSKATDATTFIAGPSFTAYEAAHQALQKWWDYNVKLAVDQTASADATYVNARITVLSLAAASIALGVFAATLIARSVTRPMSQALTLARAVTSGDLHARVEVKTWDETGQLLGELNRMTETLGAIVSSVRSSSDNVATASAQIAQGNADLSQRTEQQASALQETAATMEELRSTVRNNADSAKQADQMAKATTDVATLGGDVVGQVVGTMQGISESSRRIGDIIGVMDGIAFQTNILALNAAVEAARAGEQGRGFAVVASEVRALAQRSADSAKEIKGLISRNEEQVEQGTSLVHQAGNTMGEIVHSVRRLSDLVAEISAATTEQSSGVQQMSQAMSQMDQVTQQNAALVEESAAAAESLRTQALHLVETMAVFNAAAGTDLSARSSSVGMPKDHSPTYRSQPAESTVCRNRPSDRSNRINELTTGEARKQAAGGNVTANSAGGEWTVF